MPAGTDTTPVAASSAGTGSPTLRGVAAVVTVPFTLFGTTATPFNVSLVNALASVGLPVAPLTLGGASGLAAITAVPTITDTVAVAQLVGFKFSQIV